MLIKRLTLKKLLSFIECRVELGPLNVLIGPNASGKSNLIEVIGLLQAAPSSIGAAINRGGGIRQWLWLGDPLGSRAGSIECDLTLAGWQSDPLQYRLELSEDGAGFLISSESLWQPKGETFFGRDRDAVAFDGPTRDTATQVLASESILSQVKSPADRTPITKVGRQFSQIRIFRDIRTGPGPIRWGIQTTAPKDAISDDADNLAMVLHDLEFRGLLEEIKDRYLRRFCERFEDVKPSFGDGLAKTFIKETGLKEMLSAIRMSDGTLKFLALLAALLHPQPPPLMCIEEPEIGLHPDAIQLVAEAMVEASKSVQLIVTTHSEALVDALTDRPEAVLVCERDFDGGTQFKRLSKENLREWLQDYSLGQLWRKGEIGGGRW